MKKKPNVDILTDPKMLYTVEKIEISLADITDNDIISKEQIDKIYKEIELKNGTSEIIKEFGYDLEKLGDE